jgi:hypothetical protein
MEIKGVRLTWKTVAVGAIGLLVLVFVARSLSPGSFGGSGAINTTGGSNNSSNGSSQSTPTPQPSEQATPVSIDKRGIVGGVATGGQPTIMLNPAMVRPGTTVQLYGFGFTPGKKVEVSMKTGTSGQGTPIGQAKVDTNGSFSTNFQVPQSLVNNSVYVVAHQSSGNKTAQTQAAVPSGMGYVKLSKVVGQPGDHITITAHGFMPGEAIDVYWGRLNGPPAAKLQADGGGNVGQAGLRVGVGSTGQSTLALIGEKSQTVATSSFLLLKLWPSVKLAPYAVKSGNRLSFSAKGFAPGERVLVFVNSMTGPPAMIVQTNDGGGFMGASFPIPFGIKKNQNLILVGEQTRAVASAKFMILPYMPSVQPSTWGGLPGTSLSFYATGFAPNEVVLVYSLKTHDANGGDLVTAFRVDGKGRAAAAGSIVIGSDMGGKTAFKLVGRLSQGTAVATVNVSHIDGPVQVPPQKKYVLPPDLATDPKQPPSVNVNNNDQGGAANNNNAAPAPADNNPAPAGNNPAPADNNPAPANNNPAPAPADNNPAPANNPPPDQGGAAAGGQQNPGG